MTGTVFAIEEFSVYDGPGIRTTVFFKGCPLRCTWCHNPEGQEHTPEIVRSPNGCIDCGHCTNTAIRENGRLRFTEVSIAGCPRHLLRLCGKEYTPDALCEKLLKNAPLLQDGGVTFSGGEPLLQSDFVFACLERLKGRLHTALQTCGFCEESIFERALSLTDFMLYDLKLADEEAHRRFTGVSNAPILKNFRRLAASGLPFTPRIPLIPGVTDTKKNLAALAALMQQNGVCYAELLPYNKMAGGKYKMLLREYAPGFDETAEVFLGQEIFAAYGIQINVL